jgi:hypothetical protein
LREKKICEHMKREAATCYEKKNWERAKETVPVQICN